ncbi:hypothetical protein [Streptomyces ossamyceticus]|uniref:hypothetical protein n=1 Tax=Streptomyces ossamyceticus TaxID=249581 RepID=UPI0006E2BF66|nr:hypothetical protein [Streptomyces ossamyceticus]
MRRSGEIGGTLGIGRTEAVLGPGNEQNGDFEYAVTQEKNLIAGTVGLGVAVGTSFIATPAVGAGVGAAAGTVTSLVLEQFYKDSEPEFRKELGSDIAERWENTKDANTAMSHNAAVAAADDRNPGLTAICGGFYCDSAGVGGPSGVQSALLPSRFCSRQRRAHPMKQAMSFPAHSAASMSRGVH